jgi:hypothetical protein
VSCLSSWLVANGSPLVLSCAVVGVRNLLARLVSCLAIEIVIPKGLDRDSSVCRQRPMSGDESPEKLWLFEIQLGDSSPKEMFRGDSSAKEGAVSYLFLLAFVFNISL